MLGFNCKHGLCQSPAECALMLAFDTIRSEGEDGDDFWSHPGTDWPLKVRQQVSVGRWRCDFLLEFLEVSVAVEVDGYDYHSSKEQYERDRRRDRDLLNLGIHTVRFTGSEVLRDPMGCMDDAVAIWLELQKRDFRMAKRGMEYAARHPEQTGLIGSDKA